MQIALVATVLLAGMWFTVLKPKPADDTASVTPATPAPAATTSSAPVAPGVKGLAKAVDKAKAASSTSDATNARIQSATGGNGAATAAPSKPKAATPAQPAAAKAKAKPATTKATATPKAATPAKAAAPAKAKAKAPAAASVDPSDRLLAFLAKGKTLVVLFEGKSDVDSAARKAVHLTAKADPKHVISAYVPIGKVGDYEKITSGVQINGSPTILVIGTDRKATALTGYLDAPTVQQAVGDARREVAAAKKK